MESQRCLFEDLAEFMTLLLNIYRVNPLLLSRTTENWKIRIIKVWRDMSGKNEVFYCSVKIVLHHQPNSFHDEWIRESDEGVSSLVWFYILHDALVLMTTKETTTCMKQNVYLPRFLLPINGLKDGTPYAGRPIGNIPEVMP